MLETVLRQGVLGEDDIGEESPRCVFDIVEQQFLLNVCVCVCVFQFLLNVLTVLEIESLGQHLTSCLNTSHGYHKGKAILDIVYLNMHLALITEYEASKPKDCLCEE